MASVIYEPRTLKIRVSKAGEIREETLHGQTYYAVPVVALVEGVVWPANVENPEYVPAEVLAEHPLGWNGKPVTQSHPYAEGEGYTSANFPDVYEKYTYGLIFNAEFRDGKLLMEAWINPSLIRPGSVAERSWEALRAGQIVEVSVGAYITRLEQRGTFKGQEYFSIWQDIVPDHLAILAEGEIGACSIEMGCGALRVAARRHTITDKGIEVEPEVEMAVAPSGPTDPKVKVFCTKHPKVEIEKDSACTVCVAENPPKKSWKDRFQEALSKLVGLQSAEDMTDNDLRDKLDRGLRAVEPGYLGVVAVKPEAHEVVYAVYPEEQVLYFQRSYAVSDAGDVSFGDERVEVKYERTERYVPVSAAAAAPPKPQGPCGCHNKGAGGTPETTGETVMEKKEKVNSLITSGKFQETNRAFLESASDEILDSLMATPAPTAAAAPAAPAPAPAPAPVPAVGALAGASAQTMEQYIAAAPVHLQPSLRAAHQAQTAKRNQTIAALKGTGRCTFTDEQLASKTDQELEQLSALAAAPTVADFSGRGLPSSTDSGDGVPEPPSLVTAINNRRKVG